MCLASNYNFTTQLSKSSISISLKPSSFLSFYSLHCACGVEVKRPMVKSVFTFWFVEIIWGILL